MRNLLRLGLCSQVWREDATAPGEAEGLTGVQQRRSGGCERNSGREVASQMVVFLFLFSILMKMNLQNE